MLTTQTQLDAFLNTLQKRETILTTFYTCMCIFCDITGGLFVYDFTFSSIRSAFDPKHLCVVAEQSRKRSLSDSSSKKPDLNLSDFPFEHLHWTMELKTAVRTPHVSNWLSCWGFSQRWANKSFLTKSAQDGLCELIPECQTVRAERRNPWTVARVIMYQHTANWKHTNTIFFSDNTIVLAYLFGVL